MLIQKSDSKFMGRQRSIISKKFFAHEDGTQQDPHNPT
jgi:hypothetical protein